MAQAETEKLIEMTFGAVLSRAICTVAELGVADQITPGSPKAVEALAAATGTHERALYRMLRFLASHGIFREEGVRHFDHTRLSECLRSGVQGSYRSAAQMLHRVYAGWDGLHHAVLTGDSGFNKVFGRPLFDYIGANPDLAPIFDAGMTAIHGHETAAMLEAYDFSAVQVLADIGGGNGSLITAVLQRYPRLKGILFELDHVAERTQENFKRSGIQERCSILRGNFFDSVPSGRRRVLSAPYYSRLDRRAIRSNPAKLSESHDEQRKTLDRRGHRARRKRILPGQALRYNNAGFFLGASNELKKNIDASSSRRVSS